MGCCHICWDEMINPAVQIERPEDGKVASYGSAGLSVFDGAHGRNPKAGYSGQTLLRPAARLARGTYSTGEKLETLLGLCRQSRR